jgi:hypothetical protein
VEFHSLMSRKCGNILLADWLEKTRNHVALIFMLYPRNYAEHTACLITGPVALENYMNLRGEGFLNPVINDWIVVNKEKNRALFDHAA